MYDQVLGGYQILMDYNIVFSLSDDGRRQLGGLFYLKHCVSVCGAPRSLVTNPDRAAEAMLGSA